MSKQLYIFAESKEREDTCTLEQFPFASYNIKKLKKSILKRYKAKPEHIAFDKRYGCVRWDCGDVIGYIRIIRKIVK